MWSNYKVRKGEYVRIELTTYKQLGSIERPHTNELYYWHITTRVVSSHNVNSCSFNAYNNYCVTFTLHQEWCPELLEVPGALRASRAYREVIVGVRARWHYNWGFWKVFYWVPIFMDSRFRYEVSHVVMNCRDPQKSLRALRALGAHRACGGWWNFNLLYIQYLSDFPNLHNCLLGPIFNRPLWPLPLLNPIGHVDVVTYTLNMQPLLPDIMEELSHMLKKTLAVADVFKLNRQVQNLGIITSLWAACTV